MEFQFNVLAFVCKILLATGEVHPLAPDSRGAWSYPQLRIE